MIPLLFRRPLVKIHGQDPRVRILARFIIDYLFAASLFFYDAEKKSLNQTTLSPASYFILFSDLVDASERLNPIFDEFNSAYVIFENHHNYFLFDEIAYKNSV